MRTRLVFLFLLLLPAATQSLRAQSLVKNINQLPFPEVDDVADSSPEGFSSVGTRLYFSANTKATGRECFFLDAVNGTAQLLLDLNPSGPADPDQFLELPSGLFVFAANSPTIGRELFISDGTAQGTQPIADLVPGVASSWPNRLTVHQGTLYFIAGTLDARKLYRSDGTAQGTQELYSIGAMPTFGFTDENLVSTPQALYFTTFFFNGTNFTWRLMRTNGNPGGESVVILGTESQIAGPQGLTAAGDRLVWSAQLGNLGHEIWVSDGTPGGTTMVPLVPGTGGSDPDNFIVMGGIAYFTAKDPVYGREVYRSNGTAAGTLRITDVVPGVNAIGPFDLRAGPGVIYFAADDGVHGQELWVSDGTVGNQALYADLWPGPGSAEPRGMTELGGRVCCSARTANQGTELFVSDGTPAGTGMLVDLYPGFTSGQPGGFVPYQGRLVFSARSPMGIEPWSTDGSALGTQQIADVAKLGLDQPSSIVQMTALGNLLSFSANDGVSGPRPWGSDGTFLGTQFIQSLVPGTGATGVHGGIVFRGRSYFRAFEYNTGFELWASDGTAAGTGMVLDIFPGNASSDPTLLGVLDGRLYFTAGTQPLGRELWATDGTSQGTQLIADIVHGPFGSDPQGAVVLGDRLLFSAIGMSIGRELWHTDGTPLGTQLLKDTQVGAGSGLNKLEGVVWNGKAWFGAAKGLWSSDGTAAGTQFFASTSSLNVLPRAFQPLPGRLVFLGFDGSAYRYYGTDGNVVELLNATWSGDAQNFLASNGSRVIGLVKKSQVGSVLISTDGTAAGSVEVMTLNTSSFGPSAHHDAHRLTSGPNIYFNADTLPWGTELWRTDGTLLGTTRVTDIAPGGGSSSPTQLVRMGGSIYFSAFAPEVHAELFRLPLTDPGDWVAQPFGQGCRQASGKIPTIEAHGSAVLGGQLNIVANPLAPGAAVAYYYSATYARTVFGPCDFYLAAPQFLTVGLANGTGQAVLNLPIPNLPILSGVGFWMQGLVVDPGGSFLGLAAMTPALEVVVAP